MADSANDLYRKPFLLNRFPSKMRKSPSVVTSPPIFLQEKNKVRLNEIIGEIDKQTSWKADGKPERLARGPEKTMK